MFFESSDLTEELAKKVDTADFTISMLDNDINNYTRRWGFTAIAGNATIAGGYPQDNIPGWLESLYINDSTILQRYTGNDNKLWQRFKFAGQWTSWIQI